MNLNDDVVYRCLRLGPLHPAVKSDPTFDIFKRAVKAVAGSVGRRAIAEQAGRALDTRNARNVWTIATKPFKGAHFATMPPDLAERCIRARRPWDCRPPPQPAEGWTAKPRRTCARGRPGRASRRRRGCAFPVAPASRPSRRRLTAFEFRYLRGLSGQWRPHYTPKLKKRTALMRALKEVFRRHRSQPIERVLSLINPVLRGWVNYFAVGHPSECFSFIKDWVEKKVRRHLMQARNGRGFGWTRWNRQWLYRTLGLFNSYRARRPPPKVAPAR